MRRAVVFAHYDKDNLIDDYVVYYVSALKKAGCDVVFVSCKELAQTELEKLNGLVIHTITENHDEYDFGSYKRGFLYLEPKLSEYDELIFANDSCYGPLYPISEVFAEMEKKNCDFWGITKNNYAYQAFVKQIFFKVPHMQSYFIAFKKQIFQNSIFINFVKSITFQSCKQDIISKYEVGLSQLLYENNFRSDEYIKDYSYQALICFWQKFVIKNKMPFVKCSVLRKKNNEITLTYNWENILKQTNYPVDFIRKNLLRTQITVPQNKQKTDKIFAILYIHSPLFMKKFLIRGYKFVYKCVCSLLFS